MSRNFLPRFRSEIERLGEQAQAVIEKEGRYELRYVPFENVNRHARLVFVGITPGVNQISLSYSALREALLSGMPDEEALVFAKAAGAFGGSQMRDRLNLMMQRFRIHEVIDLAAPEEVWRGRDSILHATSIVPHAAFKDGKMFNGPFSEVLKVPLLRKSFEEDFLPTLAELSRDALFIAIGPTPWNALAWCVDNNHISAGQVLGAFAHPSGSAGSQVEYFIGRKRIDELTPGDPVLHRVSWLDQARNALEKSVAHILEHIAANPRALDMSKQVENVTRVSTVKALKKTPGRLTAGTRAVSSSPTGPSKPIPVNPMRDAVYAALMAHIDLRPHPAQKEETKYIAAFETSNGRTLALDKMSAGKQPIWIEAHLLAADALPEIRRDFYPQSRGRNSNLHKLPGFKDGALVRLYPETVDQGMAIVRLVLER